MNKCEVCHNKFDYNEDMYKIIIEEKYNNPEIIIHICYRCKGNVYETIKKVLYHEYNI